jgi:transposase
VRRLTASQCSESLKKRTAAWNKAANKTRQVIQWRFTKNKARKSMGYQPLIQHAEKLF